MSSAAEPGNEPKKPTFLLGGASRPAPTTPEPVPEETAYVAATPLMRASAPGPMPERPQLLQRLESAHEELQLLHLLLHDTDNVIGRLPQIPRSTWFPTPHHQRVYLAWKALYEAGMPVTPDAVLRTLREQAKPDELELIQLAYERVLGVVVTDAAENLAAAVRTAAQCRRFSAMVNALNQGFHQNQPIEELWERAARELAEAEDHESFRPFQEQLNLTLKSILHPDVSTLGLLTKLDQIDFLCGGLEPSQMYVMAGVQGSGKTALYLEIIMRLLEFYPDVAICVLSLEMSQMRLQQRQLSNLAYVSTRRMRDHAKPGQQPLTEAEIKRISAAYERMQGWNDRVEMHFRSMTCQDMRDTARRFAQKHRGRRKVMITDHVGLGTHAHNDMQQGIIDVIRTQKGIATDFDYAVIPLGQMVKELENKRLYGSVIHRPDQSFIYGSGFINQTADTIFCTWRPEMYVETMEIEMDNGIREFDWPTKGRMILVTGKNRDGAMNKQLILGCNMEFMQLYNIEEEKKYQLAMPLA